MSTGRTLLVSGSDHGLDGVVSFLKSCGCGSVTIVSSGDEARRNATQTDFDLLIINTPLRDEFGNRFAVQMSESTSAGIILLCKADAADDIVNQAIDNGIIIVTKPLNRTAFHRAIRISFAMNRRLNGWKKENTKLHGKLEELRYVSRAKCLLIERRQMNEVQAHRFIEKEAMDTRRTRKEVALEIIVSFDNEEDGL